MKGLTLTIVTPKIQSVNYGETIGNVSTLKKLSTGTENPKKLITYFSDKAIKFDVKRIGRDQFNWNLMNKSVVSVFVNNYRDGNFDHDNFLKDMIAKYEEFDLFGGMFADIGNVSDEIKQKINNEDEIRRLAESLGDKDEINIGEDKLKIKQLKDYFENKVKGGSKKKISKLIQESIGKEISYCKFLTIDDTNKLKRSQPVRFSNGYSISEFVYDMNLLNDIDAYNRYIQYTAGQKKQSLVYPEEHLSYYTYTLTIDLDKIGASEKEDNGRVVFEPVVDPDVRTKRVNDILKIVLLYLNRKIKGRDERLTPVFLIGGVYDVKHPFFANAIYFSEQNQKLHFNADDIKKIFDTYKSPDISTDTFLYFHDSFVDVEDKDQLLSQSEKSQLKKQNLHEILQAMAQKVSGYYEGKEQQ
jgi:CRISPR-associated autoregulator DevR family